MQETDAERRGRRRTFALGVLSGAVVITAFRLMDPTLVLAVLADRLTGSKALVGVLIAGYTVGSQLPGLFMPWVLEGHPRKLGWYRVAGVFRVLTLLSVALLLFSALPHRMPALAFGMLALLLLLATGWAGVQFIPFMDVIAKSVRPNRRGAYWAWREALGGVLALGAAPAVGYCVSEARPYAFPVGYAWVFMIVAGLITVSVTLFACTWEPPAEPRGRRMSLRMHLARGPRLLRRDRRFARFAATRALADLALMGVPFVALLGRERFGLTNADVAFLLIPSSLAAIPLPFVWGVVSDRRGTRALWRLAALLAAAQTGLTGGLILAGLIWPIGRSVALVCIGASAILGASAKSSAAIGMQNHVLDLAPVAQRDTYVGFNNVLAIPLAFATVLAGVLSDRLGLGALYGVALALSLCTVASAYLWMAEPRDFRPPKHQAVAPRRPPE